LHKRSMLNIILLNWRRTKHPKELRTPMSKIMPGAADFALIATTFLWGLNAVISKNAIGEGAESFSVIIYNGLRIPAGTVLLLIAIRLSGNPVTIRLKHLPAFALLTFFGMFMFMQTFIWGVSLTSSANTGVINATIPLMILLVSFATGIDRPTGRTAAGIAVGFAGMIVLAFRGGSLSFGAGDFLILASCFFWAIHTVFGKRVLNLYPPMLAIAWIYIFTSIFQLPFFIAELPGRNFAAVSAMNWFYLGISTVGSVFLANSLYYFSIHRIGPARTGVYTNLTPVFTLLMAVLIRGEHISLMQTGGLVLIVSGIAISRSKPSAATVSGR